MLQWRLAIMVPPALAAGSAAAPVAAAAASGTFRLTASMNAARICQSATLLPGGQVLVAGGESVTKGKITVLSGAELCTS